MPAFRNPWWVVVGGVVGLFVCNGPILTYTSGVFLKPIMADMGWQRGTASFALACGEFLAAFSLPLLGRMMDRWTIRRVALPGIVAFAASLCLMALTPRSLLVFTILSTLTYAASTVQTPLAYTKAISAWFDRRRGLALGIALAGIGFGGMIVPQLANYFIARFGWRIAYVLLGIMVLAIAFPAVALWVREPQPGEGERPRGQRDADLPGLTAREAAATAPFWLLAATFFFVALALLGFSGHVVPLLTDRGLSAAAATATFGLFGLSTLCGRLLTGFLIDRIFASYIATVLWLAPIAGFMLLSTGTGFLPAIGVVLLGVGLGTEVDLIAFMLSRYLGLRAFGTIYGIFFMMFGLGGSLGRFLAGYLFDLAGSYNPALIGASAALIVAVVLINRLGPYVYPVELTVPGILVAKPST
ncbi:MAG: MFS transporter [Alphaproteobacteria bacterium]|nr:MFS transporter [Alphaproteobacteria bacterium]